MSFIELAKKYSASSIANFQQESTNSILQNHKDLLTAQKIRLLAEQSIVESEVEILKTELEEFILFYYENFITKVMSRPALELSNSNSEKIITKDDEEEFDEIYFFSNKKKALEKNLKSAYHKLAKLFHPDKKNQQNHSAEINNIDFSFNDLQKLYDDKNLEKMIEILELVKSQSLSFEKLEKDLVFEIETLEREVTHLKSNILYLKNIRDDILQSAEYRLFNKYRVFEIRGLDFFETLQKSFLAKI